MNSIRSLLASTKVTFSGLFVAQAISLLGTLVIARIFSPSEFGLFSLWLGITSVASLLVSGRLELCLLMVPEGTERLKSLRLVLATIVYFILLLCILTIISWLFFDLINNQTKIFIVMFIFVAGLAATMQAWQSWVVSEGDYGGVSLSRIAQAVMVTGSQILIGLISPSAEGMVLGHSLGIFAALLISLKIKSITQINLRPTLAIFHQLIGFWTHHKKFIVYSLPADILSVTTSYIPLVLIIHYYGPAEGGLFALVVRIMGGPITLVGTAVLDVFKREAALAVLEFGHCRDLYLTTLKFLAATSLLMITVVVMFGKLFFEYAYGDMWKNAGNVALWLLPLFVAKFLASPLSYIFYIVGAQRIDLIWQSALLVVTLIIFLLTNSFEFAVQCYSISYAVMYSIYIAISYRLSKGFFK